MGEPLVVTRDGAVAVLTIDRPDKRNAMTAGDVGGSCPACSEALAGDPAVRVLVVTGAGPSFCAGADISEPARRGRSRRPRWPTSAGTTSAAQAALRAFPKPTAAR